MGCNVSTQGQTNNKRKNTNKKHRNNKNDDETASLSGSTTRGTENTTSAMGPTAYPPDNSEDIDEADLSSISSDDLSRAPTPNATASSAPQNNSQMALQKKTASLSDLSAAREASVPSIEEELFVYDGVAFSKSADWLKKARVAGRKPPRMPTGKRGSGGNSDQFQFGDFNVAVIDEVNDMDLESSQHGKAPHGANAPPPSLDQNGSPTTGPPGELSTNGPRPQRTEYTGIRRFEVTNLLGHASRVKCIAIAPSETEYVSCSNEDASVTLFGFKSGKEMGIFTGHQDTVINATFSSDGKYLATTSRDHTMILWDVVTAKQILTFDHSKVVICCCFSKDSKYIATGCQDKICRLWETRRGRECLIFAQHEGIIISMSYAPDNMNIVSASADKTLRVWSTTTGKTKHLLQGHSGIVLSCQFTGDGKKIISNDEKLLKVWNAQDGSCVLTLAVDEVNSRMNTGTIATKKLTWTLSCIAPGDFTDYLFVACNNRFVYLLDINTGEEVSSIFCKAPVYCLTPGFHNLSAFGDSFGNIYVVRIE